MSERIVSYSPIYRLSTPDFVKYLVEHGSNSPSEFLAVQPSSVNLKEQVILINTSIVPIDLELYFIIHEDSHLQTQDRRKRNAGVREILGLLGPQYIDPDTGEVCLTSADQARAIYDEYLSAYDDQQLARLHQWMEDYTSSTVQFFSQRRWLKLQLKTDIFARRIIKTAIERGIRITEEIQEYLKTSQG